MHTNQEIKDPHILAARAPSRPNETRLLLEGEEKLFVGFLPVVHTSFDGYDDTFSDSIGRGSN